MIGIIGGTGLYALLDPVSQELPDTPYGTPSAPITLSKLGEHELAFLPRHGTNHQFPAHKVPYRANLWALRALGCQQVLAPCAVGSLVPEIGPGSFVLPDQLIDRTAVRDRTYFDDGAVHINFAEPYCPRLRAELIAVCGEINLPAIDGGAMVVIEGPRFSTRAESLWHASIGGTVVNMTGAPEAALARELEMCYAPVAIVTDHDAGSDSGQGVTQADVISQFALSIENLKVVLISTLGRLTTERACSCADALKGLDVPIALPISLPSGSP